MSIRYECEQCGSVLKIKEDLAGKPGKCPKCKTPFTVPAAAEDSETSGEEPAGDLSESAESNPAESRSADSSSDFDVDAFLSSDDDSDVKTKPKAAKRSRPTKDVDPDLSLDEPDETSPSKRSKTRSSEEKGTDAFQIRRGPDAPGKAASAPEPEEDESDGKSASSRRPPGTNPNAHAANIASDLLSKSAKKGKKTNWDEVEAKKKEEPGFDWDGLWYEARTKLLPVLGGGAAFLLLVYFFVFPMFGGKSFVPKLGTVTGTVTVNGKPLAGATVWFGPEEKKQESKGKNFKVSASVAQTDANGHYELMYDPQSNLKGAVIGKCRVEIVTPNYAGISDKYYKNNANSAKVEVKAGKQVINLELSQ